MGFHLWPWSWCSNSWPWTSVHGIIRTLLLHHSSNVSIFLKFSWFNFPMLNTEKYIETQTSSDNSLTAKIKPASRFYFQSWKEEAKARTLAVTSELLQVLFASVLINSTQMYSMYTVLVYWQKYWKACLYKHTSWKALEIALLKQGGINVPMGTTWG